MILVDIRTQFLGYGQLIHESELYASMYGKSYCRNVNGTVFSSCGECGQPRVVIDSFFDDDRNACQVHVGGET